MYGKALEIRPMKIWKLPKGKEHMRDVVCTNGDYFGQVKKDGYWYAAEIDDDGNIFLFARDESVKTPGHLTERSAYVPHIMNELKRMFPPGTIIIGEIYYPQVGKTGADVGKIMGCTGVDGVAKAIARQDSNEYGKLHYYIHDVIRYGGSIMIDWDAWKRWKFLESLWEDVCMAGEPRYIELAETFTENMSARIDDIINNGGEGAVLKLKTGKYVPGKKPAWNMIKFKCEDSADVICIGFDAPTKEYTGTEPLENWKYWMKEDTGYDPGDKMMTPDEMCISPGEWAIQLGYKPVSKPYWHGWIGAIQIGVIDENAVPEIGDIIIHKFTREIGTFIDGGPDNTIGVVRPLGTVWSGLTEEILEAIKADKGKFLGMPLELKCMQVYGDGTLRHPVFSRWRDDLNVWECTLKKLTGKD